MNLITNKSICLSSAGLKNLVFHEAFTQSENEFKFIFGKREIKMHKLFAEFLSPTVAHFQHCDPTINSISYDQLLINFEKVDKSINKNFDDLISEKIISQIEQISSGSSIIIDENDISKFRFLSILFGNQELLSIIDNTYPNYIDDLTIDQKIEELHNLRLFPTDFDENLKMRLIDQISSQFNKIDSSKLAHLPISILYLILTNEHLSHEDEDSIFELIEKVFSEKVEFEKEDSICINDFYELIDLTKLSTTKQREFISGIDFTSITGSLWQKLCEFFLNGKSEVTKEDDRKGIKIEIEFDKNPEHRLHGIINYLTEKCGGNVMEKGVVELSASSINTSLDRVVDLKSTNVFQTKNRPNQWIKYDFGKRRIRPSSYSIRSKSSSSWAHGGNLQNWVIEGSNDDIEWKVLDRRSDVTALQINNQMETFYIDTLLQPDESFRYIRITQTGKSTGDLDYLSLSALEFFGLLFE